MAHAYRKMPELNAVLCGISNPDDLYCKKQGWDPAEAKKKDFDIPPESLVSMSDLISSYKKLVCVSTKLSSDYKAQCDLYLGSSQIDEANAERHASEVGEEENTCSKDCKEKHNISEQVARKITQEQKDMLLQLEKVNTDNFQYKEKRSPPEK